MTLRLRDLTDDERTEVQRITRLHTLGAAFVRRAQIVIHAMSGLKAEEIASRMDLGLLVAAFVRHDVHSRFQHVARFHQTLHPGRAQVHPDQLCRSGMACPS